MLEQSHGERTTANAPCSRILAKTGLNLRDGEVEDSSCETSCAATSDKRQQTTEPWKAKQVKRPESREDNEKDSCTDSRKKYETAMACRWLRKWVRWSLYVYIYIYIERERERDMIYSIVRYNNTN